MVLSNTSFCQSQTFVSFKQFILIVAESLLLRIIFSTTKLLFLSNTLFCVLSVNKRLLYQNIRMSVAKGLFLSNTLLISSTTKGLLP